MTSLVVGSRGSDLARTQSEGIVRELRGLWPELEVELRIVVTSGDRDRATALRDFGGKGAFTKELEEELLAGRIDVAVHSLKDLPTELPAGLALGAVPRREDPRDALCGARLDDLAPGARVGTGSPRRAAQLRYLRPDLRVEAIRGNVPTRLGRLEGADPLDAVLLAVAGLKRLGLEGRVSEALDPQRFPCAPGQGALGLETRADDPRVARVLAALHDEAGARSAGIEREVLAGLGGGCSAPVGVFVGLGQDGAALDLVAQVTATDGSQAVRHEASRPLEEGGRLAAEAAAALLAGGADRLLSEARGGSSGAGA